MDGSECGNQWYNDQWNGTSEIQDNLSATGLFTANLVAFEKQAPGTQANPDNQTSSGSATATTTTSPNGTSTSTSTSTAAATTTSANSASGLAGGSFVMSVVVFAGLMAMV